MAGGARGRIDRIWGLVTRGMGEESQGQGCLPGFWLRSGAQDDTGREGRA